MIKVTRLNGSEYYVNDDLIEFLESTPETVLTMTDGKKQTVKETPAELLGRIVEFRRLAALPPLLEHNADPA